jgi:hypothetical protein
MTMRAVMYSLVRPDWAYLILFTILSLGHGTVRFLGYIRAHECNDIPFVLNTDLKMLRL